MKKILIYAGLALVLAVVAVLSGRYISTLKNDNRRLQSNQTALLTDVEYWQDEAQRNYTKVQGITLKVSELEALRAKDARIIKDLGVRLHNAQSLITANVTIRDTIYLTKIEPNIDSLPLKTLSTRYYEDEWTKIVSTPGEAVYSTNVPITLVTTTKQKRYLWGLFWGRVRGVEVVIRSSTPHAVIDSLQYIQLQH